MSRINTGRRGLVLGIATALAMGATAAPALAGNQPTIVAQANGAFVLGGVSLEVTCTAKANQSLVKVTIIRSCYTTNGLRAAGDTETGAVATSATAGSVDPGSLGTMQICAEALSYDQFGIPSDVASYCQDVNPLTGGAVMVR